MRIWHFTLTRLAHTLVTIWAVTTLMWLMFRLIPGDPTTIFLGTGALPPEAIEAMRETWGLNEPLLTQYAHYMANLLTGDFGMSFYFRMPVSEVILPAMGNTLLLMGTSIPLAALFGVLIGSWLGWRRGSRAERIGNILVLIPRSIPNFGIGILLLIIFSYGLGWFPVGGMRQPGFYPETAIQAIPGFDLARHLVLPMLASVIYFMSDPLMIMRSSMLDVKEEDFILYARARGLKERKVRALARYNAIRPVVTYIAIMVGFAFGGQVVLEVVFSWPGMGRLMVDSVAQRDYPVAQAAFFIMAVVVILLNFLLDILYIFLDPRIRYDH